MKKSIVAFLFLILSLVFTPISFADPVKVFVSILPQKYFLEKIGGDLVDVSVMVPPGANPHTYEPKPAQMADLSKSKAYFSVGVPFEAVWLSRFHEINRDMHLFRTDEGIEKRPIEETLPLRHHASHKDHGHTHSAGSLDPHIWLSPPLVLLQARNILGGLIRIDPGNSERYRDNFQRFSADVVRLDLEILSLFEPPQEGVRFMVFHPSWGYFAEAYGLTQLPIEVGGKEPKPAELGELITLARKEGVKAIFVQPQFSKRSAETFAREIGARVFHADPLAEDWAENLKQVADGFKQALR
jgi:zinc transport system substrate-binding protein